MKIPLVGVLALSAALLPALRAQTPPAASAPPPLPTLYICGDSTAAPSGGLIRGWGQMEGDFFDPARIHVENRALGGRSARTFIAEGRWEAVRSHLRPGDFVIVQFGHNDTKSAINATRYDLAGLGDESEEIANPKGGGKITIRTF
jgi:rhamnogalacturonan acetylesterase